MMPHVILRAAMDGLDAARATLVTTLDAHAPLDAAEAVHLADVRELVLAEPRCFDRSLYEPGHLTGSAFVVDASTGRVLLHRHRRLGRWLQMGGHDDGEHDLAATALREAREESGLEGLALARPEPIDVDVHLIPAARGEPAHRHFDVRYAVLAARPDAPRHDPAESLELAWVPLSELSGRMAEPGAARAAVRLARLLDGQRRDQAC
jgi:8-oxo-dGTP pyrophosphatase MutT (NUDIX family)